MNRPDVAPILDLRGWGASERLELAAGEMAARLADLLDRALPADEVTPSREFLLAMSAASEDPATRWRLADEVNPLDRLVERFGLSNLEVDLLVLAGLPDEHEGFAGILRTLHPGGEPRPTAGLAAQLFCADRRDRRELRTALQTGVLARHGLVRLIGDGPFFERTLHLAESLWPALHGLDVWPAAVQLRDDPLTDAGLTRWLTSEEVAPALAAIGRDEPLTILITAETDETALQRGAVLASAAAARPVRLVVSEPLTPELQRLIAAHAIARGVLPVIRPPAPEGPGNSMAPEFPGYPGALLICGRFGSIASRGERPVVEIRAERLSPTERHELWSVTVPELADDVPALAARYTVEPETALAAAEDARAIARLYERPLELRDVAHGVRTRAGLAISSGVRLIRPTARWAQLVLPDRRMAQLREALDRLVHQPRVLDQWGFLAGRPGARGVRLLFAGASGTGKTFSSEVMAAELGVDLLLVDISRVVSKWIGETEKNLAEVFDVAERAQAVLLFDEADALFGRRTEVADAHDRYANLETAFLLSRLERFEGLAILATNLRQNIDPAFTRRLEFVLDFEEPGRAERLALWQTHIPSGAPIADDVDLRDLASLYAVVGGFIRNAAVSAGFYAAADGSPISRTHLVRAIRREYEKSGRAFPGYPAGMAAL
ncbi:MAG: AAA family ATPase [Gemmatimonas sp.]|nr:AAA family ATPase [Gemmatimonas sp.]